MLVVVCARVYIQLYNFVATLLQYCSWRADVGSELQFFFFLFFSSSSLSVHFAVFFSSSHTNFCVFHSIYVRRVDVLVLLLLVFQYFSTFKRARVVSTCMHICKETFPFGSACFPLLCHVRHVFACRARNQLTVYKTHYLGLLLDFVRVRIHGSREKQVILQIYLYNTMIELVLIGF